MNMLTGVSGNANEQMFYGRAEVGAIAQTEQIFPEGQSGLQDGEWKMVNKPIQMGFLGNIDNFVLEFVPSGTKAVAKQAKKSEKGVDGVEGVFMPGSIQAVGTGNVFNNKSCPAGSVDDGLFCRFPDQWEECGAGEIDTGTTCQSGGQYDGGFPPKFAPFNIRPKKYTPMRIEPKY